MTSADQIKRALLLALSVEGRVEDGPSVKEEDGLLLLDGYFDVDRMVGIMALALDGYRPADWPTKGETE